MHELIQETLADLPKEVITAEPTTNPEPERRKFLRQRAKRFKRPKIRRGLTAYLFFPTLLANAMLTTFYFFGYIPWWLHFTAVLPLYWYCYVTAHDAIHRAAHQSQRVNHWTGWISTALFGLPFPLMRRAHLSHHANEGKADDIERFAYRPGWRLPFGVLFGNLFFYTHFSKCNRVDQRSAIVFAAIVITLVAIFPTASLFGWVLPMQLVFAVGMFTNIYLPHGRFQNWVEKRIPFVTGYHEDHHAMPGYPWHQICQRKIRLACRR